MQKSTYVAARRIGTDSKKLQKYLEMEDMNQVLRSYKFCLYYFPGLIIILKVMLTIKFQEIKVFS